MADVRIEITADANQATAALDKVENSVRKLGNEAKTATGSTKQWGSSFIELNSAVELAERGFEALQNIFKSTVGDSMAYGIQMRTLAQNIGTTTEEASRLYQAMDDFGVSGDSVATAFEMMTKRGLAPSIDALAQLADQYNAISDPEERAALMSEKLGRNWAVLTPALREGGDAIRQAAAGIEDGLIVTEKAAQQAREYQKAVDALSDSWTAFKMKIGNWAAPGVTSLLNNSANAASNVEAVGGYWARGLGKAQLAALQEYQQNVASAMNFDPMIAKYRGMAPAASPAANMSPEQAMQWRSYYLTIQEGANAAKADEDRLNRSMGQLQLFMAGPVSKENEDYVKQQRKIQDALTESAAKIRELQKQPWKKKDLDEQLKGYQELRDQYYANAESHQDAGKKIVFDIVQQQMSMDGLTKDEGANLVKLAEKFGLVDESTAQLYESIQGATGEMESGKMTADGWLATMQQLATTWTIKVNWEASGNLPPGISVPVNIQGKTGSQGGMGGNKKGNQYASGADFVVPQGYNENFPVYASSGERVKITPAGRAQGSGGNGDVNIYGGRTYINVPGSTKAKGRLPRVRG